MRGIYLQEQGFCGFCIFFGMLPAPQQVAFLLDPWSRDQGLTDRTLPAGRFRPHASYLRKEARCRASAKKLPRGTPWKGFLWTLPETEGPRSLWHPGAARHGHVTSRAMLRTFERSIVGSTTNLADPTWRKANFLWKFLCAGSPPARIFAEQKCLAAAKDC